MPFIPFDIIGLQYFLKHIKPLLFQHKLMTYSQFCDILLSWHDESRYNEKFTSKRQRFFFEENYLTSINDIEVGDNVDCVKSSGTYQGFYMYTVDSVSKRTNTMVLKRVGYRAHEFKWKMFR